MPNSDRGVTNRDTIGFIYCRWSKQNDELLAVTTSSYVNEEWLNTEQKDMKASQVKCRLRKHRRSVNPLKRAMLKWMNNFNDGLYERALE